MWCLYKYRHSGWRPSGWSPEPFSATIAVVRKAYVYSEDVNCCISPVFGNGPSCQRPPILAPSWLSATSSGDPQLTPQQPGSNRSMAGYHWRVKIRATCCLTKAQIPQGPMVTASVCHPRSTPNLRKRVSVLVWTSLPQAFRVPWCTDCWGKWGHSYLWGKWGHSYLWAARLKLFHSINSCQHWLIKVDFPHIHRACFSTLTNLLSMFPLLSKAQAFMYSFQLDIIQ